MSEVDLESVIACAAADVPIEGSLADDVRSLIEKHALAPLAHRLGLSGFDRAYLASSLFFESQQRSAGEAIDAISRAGVPVLLIKGMSVATRLYTDPAERPMSDVDLLVPPAAHSAAASALRRLGYWIAGAPGERGPFHHAASFKRRGSSIDLHRAIVQPLRRGARSDGLFRRAVSACGPLAPALHPDPVDEALIILVHMARHELSVRAINVVDAARALDRLSDDERGLLEERARRLGLAHPIELAIAMTNALARRGPAPPSLAGPIADLLARRPPSRPVQLWRKLVLTDGVADASRLALGSLLERLF